MALITPIVPGRAAAAPPQSCTIIGYTASNAGEADRLRKTLLSQSSNELSGVQLGRSGTWKIPNHSVPIVVIESTQPLTAGSATVSVFGQSFAIASGSGGTGRRFVSTVTMPLLGQYTRNVKIQGHGDGCVGSFTVVVDRSPYSTVAGLGGVGLAVVGGILAILLARRRRAGRVSRVLTGGLFGLLAGAGEALVLHETGVIAPDSRYIVAGPLAGLLIGILLARPWKGRRHAVPAASEVDRDDFLVRSNCVDPPVLLTAVRPDAEDPAEAQARFDRHASVIRQLSGADGLPRHYSLAGSFATQPQIVTTLQRHLDAGQPLTGQQAAVVVRDVLTGLIAVHAAGLAHGDVGSHSIDLTVEGAMLGTFECTERGEPAADLQATGVLLRELLVGDVPPAMADLLADGPATAAAFRDALDEAAATAYGPDWMSVGAFTGAVLVPAAAIAVTGSLAAGTASGVGSGATTGLAAVEAGATKAVVAIPAALGATVAVIVAVVATVAAPTPAAANEVLDPARARVITVNTWGEARAGNRSHLADSLSEVLPDLLKLPGVGSAELSDIRIGIPRDQRGYPAYFVATATAKLSDGRTLYVIARFTRASAGQPWKLQTLRYETDKAKLFVPAIDPDGYLVPPPTKLVADPATLPKRYADWGTRVAASKALGTDPLLSLGPDTEVLQNVAKYQGVYDKTFFDADKFTPGGVEQSVVLADGSLLVWFNVTNIDDTYNQPAPRTGSCETSGYLYWNPAFGWNADEHFSYLHAEYVLTIQARIPPTGKVTVDWEQSHLAVRGGTRC
jgi:hypothetical protein